MTVALVYQEYTRTYTPSRRQHQDREVSSERDAGDREARTPWENEENFAHEHDVLLLLYYYQVPGKREGEGACEHREKNHPLDILLLRGPEESYL